MSQIHEETGTIKIIGETKAYASGFTKREFVITTHDDKYPQDLKFEAVKAGCDKLDAYRVGDGIKVGFAINGNEYQGKHYVNLKALRMDKAESDGLGVRSPEHGKQERPAHQNGAMPPGHTDHEEDDIPF